MITKPLWVCGVGGRSGDTYIRNKFPRVWSSRLKVKVPVFVIFESATYDTRAMPSGTSTAFKRSGMFACIYTVLKD